MLARNAVAILFVGQILTLDIWSWNCRRCRSPDRLGTWDHRAAWSPSCDAGPAGSSGAKALQHCCLPTNGAQCSGTANGPIRRGSWRLGPGSTRSRVRVGNGARCDECCTRLPAVWRRPRQASDPRWGVADFTGTRWRSALSHVDADAGLLDWPSDLGPADLVPAGRVVCCSTHPWYRPIWPQPPRPGPESEDQAISVRLRHGEEVSTGTIGIRKN